MFNKKIEMGVIVLFLLSFLSSYSYADRAVREERRERQLEELQKRFEWWPSDARPGPVKDLERGGYWWWPEEPGKIRPWGNRGYVYVHRIIFDYKAEELPPPKPQELRPSLLIKRTFKNVRIFFDYDRANLRDDAIKILQRAAETLRRNPEASILVTGNTDRRGSVAHNKRLGRARAEAVKNFMLDNNISEERIRIISRGKLDAVAPITDLVGMQKDRNAHFVIAEVEEVMLPYPGVPEIPEAKRIEEGKYILEEEKQIKSEIRVSTREYIIQRGDTLSRIAKEQLGAAHRWRYLYELNRDRIDNPHRLRVGQRIVIPIE